MSSTPAATALRTFVLKHPEGCTGHFRRMYWIQRSPLVRGFEFNNTKLQNPHRVPDWPRHGALVRGVLHNMPKKFSGSFDWVEVAEYKQANTDKWVALPEDTWLPAWKKGMVLEEQKQQQAESTTASS